MDLLVPCIVEGRSELRNVGRVNCKTHWPFSGCGTPYSLNVYIALQIKLRVLTLPAARSVESALYNYAQFILCLNIFHYMFQNYLPQTVFSPLMAKYTQRIFLHC